MKPENILIDFEGHVKLADFGLAKMNIGDDEITKTFCGSPAYFSPDLLTGKGSSKSSDIYTLGVLLYELLIG